MVERKLNEDNEPMKIGIIGCGWLGKALTKKLVSNHYLVVATTQKQENLTNISALGAQAEQLILPLKSDEGNNAAVFYCDVLVVCLTPQLRRGKTDYAEKITQIVQHAQRGCVKKIILISTTAIYDGIIGKATENTPLKRHINKVDILAQAEQEVLAFTGKSVVMRCGGLVGEGRHPGKFFGQNKQLSAPNAYVNLIHQIDVVNQIFAFIESNLCEGIFNAVSEMEVTKKHYYSIAANALNLPQPTFDKDSEVELGKQVIGNKLRDSLPYQYQHNDLVTWLFQK